MKTTVIENFLTEDEIFDIEKLFRSKVDTVVWIEPTEVDLAHSQYWYPGESYKEKLNIFLNNKIESFFEKNICDNWHILNAYRPYGIHTDSIDDEHDSYVHMLNKGHDFGWTFLIPLDDYPTNTIVFNESSSVVKVSTKWITKENRKPLGLITDELHTKYLTHQGKEITDYFSIETIFSWKKGNLLAMPRKSFHCSDNFLNKKIFEKRAIVGWSMIPIKK